MYQFFQILQGSDIRGACKIDDDCEYLFNCNMHNQCVHEDILGLGWLQIIGNILIVVIIGISTAGGLGGGIEKVPILMVLLNYSQKTATVFTYALMFGANFSNFFMLIPQRHPEMNKPIIDYEIALIILPTSLFGSALGTMLNKMLPDILLMCVFIVLMVCLVPGLITKANQQRQKDLRKSTIRSLKESLLGSVLEEDFISGPIKNERDAPTRLTLEQKQEYQKYELQDKARVPWKMFSLIFFMFIFIEGTVLLRGGKDKASWIGIQYCSTNYWLWTAMIAFLLALLTIVNKWIVCSQQKKKIECCYFRTDVQLSYTWINYLKIWGAGMTGGLMGGMLGVGSGSLMVPLLILFNVNSRVAAATSGFSKLFISAATVVLALVEGELPLADLGFFIGLAVFGGLALTAGIYYFVTKYRQQSTIIYIVAGFLVLNVFSGMVFIVKEALIFDRWSQLTKTYAYC